MRARQLIIGLLITPFAAVFAQKAVHVDLSREKVNAEPSKFLPMVGSWVRRDAAGLPPLHQAMCALMSS